MHAAWRIFAFLPAKFEADLTISFGRFHGSKFEELSVTLFCSHTHIYTHTVAQILWHSHTPSHSWCTVKYNVWSPCTYFIVEHPSGFSLELLTETVMHRVTMWREYGLLLITKYVSQGPSRRGHTLPMFRKVIKSETIFEHGYKLVERKKVNNESYPRLLIFHRLIASICDLKHVHAQTDDN